MINLVIAFLLFFFQIQLSLAENVLQTANCKLQTANCKLQTANCKLNEKSDTDIISNDSILKLMQNRYTVRTFRSQNLKKGDLDKILNVGILAPSKNKLFPYRIVVLTNSWKGKKLKRKLWSQYTLCYHCNEKGEKLEQRINSVLTAPINIIFFLDLKPEDHEKSENPDEIKDILIFRATRDAMISATAMMLQAEQLGYGTAFTGVNSSMHKFKKQLKIPLTNRYLVTLSIGYKKDPLKTIPKNYKAPLIDYDCLGKLKPARRYTVLKYSSKKDEKGNRLPLIVTRSIDVGPKNSEKTHLIKKY